MMDSLVPGTLLARRYRLLNRIGVGGMSVIWRANDESLDRIVAVKVLAADLAADARFRELVRAEARAAAALQHRHITAVYDYGETFNSDGALTAYVVMELLQGEPLSARLTEGPLPWPEAVRIGAEVAEALAAAHRLGIVHRDITADNVMLTSGGAKLLDFGIATTVGAPDEDSDGMTFGTPAYVAPERLDGHRARPATDTYALGVLLFEMLTGRPPYPAETWEELAATQREQPPPLSVPGLPSAVAVLCRRGLATDPRQRPTASQLAETLRRQLPGATRRRSTRAAYRLVAVAGTAAALALGTLAGATLLSPAPQPKTYPPAAGTALPGEPAPGAADRQPGSPPPDGARSGLGAARPPGAAELPGGVELPGVDRLPPDGELSFGSLTYLIADGHARNDIREDVALDLRQLVDNLQRELAAGSTDLPSATALVRDKVRTRAAEGSLTAGLAAELDAALDQLVG
jgi:serine/threonine-protein kinase